jgi:hypothetical protein
VQLPICGQIVQRFTKVTAHGYAAQTPPKVSKEDEIVWPRAIALKNV